MARKPKTDELIAIEEQILALVVQRNGLDEQIAELEGKRDLVVAGRVADLAGRSGLGVSAWLERVSKG